MAWIIWREADVVREAYKDYSESHFEWKQRAGTVGYNWNSKAAVWQPIVGCAGWELDRRRGPTVFDVMSMATGSDGEDAQCNLWEKLRQGSIRARGILPKGGAWRWIPAEDWDEIGYFDPPAGRPEAIGTQDKVKYFDVGICRRDIIDLWPPSASNLPKFDGSRGTASPNEDTTSGAEYRFTRWLIFQMKANPAKPVTNMKLREAPEANGIGKRAFERAKRNAIAETGAHAWGSGGAPKKGKT